VNITKKPFLLLIVTSITLTISATSVTEHRQRLQQKSNDILDMIKELRETYDDLENLGNKEIDTTTELIDTSLQEIKEARKTLDRFPKRLLSIADPFDGMGLRDTNKTIILMEAILRQTRKIAQNVKKSFTDGTHKLNPTKDPLKIYSKLGSAYSNMSSATQDLKLFEGLLGL